MMADKTQIQPKVFCSYSWTNQEYQNRVIEISERLMTCGIEVLLDKWDLVEGADTHAYMEKCVSDKSVTHVLLFCDSAYAEKADKRAGGVGKETLIITPELYNQEDVASKEQRYLPIVMEKNAAGKAFLPVYLAGRYFIDLSSEEMFAESFEQLVRAIYGKPFYKKPKLGKAPAYIQADSNAITGLSTYKESALSAVREQKPYAFNRCREYFEAFSNQLDSFRLNDTKVEEDFDDIIISKINEFHGPKDECVDVICAMIREYNTIECGDVLHNFFECIFTYTQWPENLHEWDEIKSDHFKFLIHELFLYTCTYALKYEKEIIIDSLFSDYYCKRNSKKEMRPYTLFQMGLRSFQVRNSRLELRRISLQSDILSERLKTRIDLDFEHIMQSDLFMFLYSRIVSDGSQLWYPFTLVFAEDKADPFEIFARAQSRKKCLNLLKLLKCDSLEQFKSYFKENDVVMKYYPGEWHGRIDMKQLCGLDKLGTKD